MPDISPPRFTPPTCPKCGAVRTRAIAKNGIEEWLIHNPGCVVLAPEPAKGAHPMTAAETAARARAHEILGPSLKCTADHHNALCLRIASEVWSARRAVIEARIDVWQAVIDETNDEDDDDLDGEAACIRLGGWLGEQAEKARADLAEIGEPAS